MSVHPNESKTRIKRTLPRLDSLLGLTATVFFCSMMFHLIGFFGMWQRYVSRSLGQGEVLPMAMLTFMYAVVIWMCVYPTVTCDFFKVYGTKFKAVSEVHYRQKVIIGPIFVPPAVTLSIDLNGCLPSEKANTAKSLWFETRCYGAEERKYEVHLYGISLEGEQTLLQKELAVKSSGESSEPSHYYLFIKVEQAFPSYQLHIRVHIHQYSKPGEPTPFDQKLEALPLETSISIHMKRMSQEIAERCSLDEAQAVVQDDPEPPGVRRYNVVA